MLAERYELEALIGVGGMAKVFRATDRRTGAVVAVKRLRVDAGIPDARDRFAREVRLLDQIDHPHCVRLLDHGVDGDVPFAVLELLIGADLRDAMRGPLPPSQVIALTRQLIEALSELHARDIIHRDVKPENLMLTRDANGRDRLVLVDFGAALPVGPGYEGPCVKRTAAGFVLGTPVAIPPEQLQGAAVGVQTDLYAVGALMFELLTGEMPFTGDPAEILREKMQGRHPKLPPCAPKSLAMLVHSLMHPDPSLRLASVRATLRALAFADIDLRRSRRPHTWHDLLGPEHSVVARSHTMMAACSSNA